MSLFSDSSSREKRKIFPLGAPLARLAGVGRCVRTVHLDLNLKGTALRQALQCFAVRLGVRGFDATLAISRATREKLVAAGADPRRVIVHYWGLVGDRAASPTRGAETRRALDIPERAAVLGCITFDNPVKGLDVLLEAFAILRRTRREAVLVLIGVNPERGALPAQARVLGVEGAILWPGIMDNAWRMLDDADIYVQPSRSEGLPNTVMEAMSLSLPVVASRVGGMGELVVEGESGLLVPPENPSALARALESLLEAPALRRRFGKAGRSRFLAEFRGEASVRRLVQNVYLKGLP